MTDALPLWPLPRHAERLGGTIARAPLAVSRDPSLPAQGFVLDTADTPTLRAADDAGERYGRAAFAQLEAAQTKVGAEMDAGALPRLRIEDHPDFPVRGWMLDVSRDRVPTRETLAMMLDWMDALRLNHLQLYTEHTFAYREHETVWRDASPITADDVHWLDAACAERGIELCANQNLFGHMARWLSHDAYRSRAEAPEGWKTRFGFTVPASGSADAARDTARVRTLRCPRSARGRSRAP